MKDWYQYQPWNNPWKPVKKTMQMSYHTTFNYQIAAAQWRMVQFGTPRVGPIHTPNIGLSDEGLISISAMKYNPWDPVKKINAYVISYDGTTTKLLRPNGGWFISGPQGSVLSTPHILNPSMKDWYQYLPWILTCRAQLRGSRHMTYYSTALL